MSFQLTQPQILARTKTVTRRLGWVNLRVGERLLAVDRVMGFRPGQRAKLLSVIEVVSVRREPLYAITPEEVLREGFGLDARDLHDGMREFVAMFCREMKCDSTKLVTRIEFRYPDRAHLMKPNGMLTCAPAHAGCREDTQTLAMVTCIGCIEAVLSSRS